MSLSGMIMRTQFDKERQFAMANCSRNLIQGFNIWTRSIVCIRKCESDVRLKREKFQSEPTDKDRCIAGATDTHVHTTSPILLNFRSLRRSFIFDISIGVNLVIAGRYSFQRQAPIILSFILISLRDGYIYIYINVIF